MRVFLGEPFFEAKERFPQTPSRKAILGKYKIL